ncbi:MAG: cyclic nucleotide-binding domain-containing protein [Deltaproteobacteria bacterium]|nr:cyclic nucleotide-binding domain-containing protein [Deltaproteobacteria bacterium]
MLDRNKIRKDAEHYLIDGSYAKAMEELGKLCVIETNDPWVWSSLGECYVNTGDDQKAAKNFMTAYKKFLQQNDLQSALSALERVLSLDSGNKEAGENRARLLNRLSKEGIKPVQSIAKKIPIFSEIEEHELNDILKIARAISFPEGRTIIEEGSKGDSIYFIVSGIVSVSKKGKDGKDIMLDTLSDGRFLRRVRVLHRRQETGEHLVGEHRGAVRAEKAGHGGRRTEAPECIEGARGLL